MTLAPFAQPMPADIPTSPAAERRCRNCGEYAPGAYCPACGQETRDRLPTLREFMREAAGRLVAFDGKLWKTLGALFFRPGFLTREYFAGRRRRYIRPARLFLIASLILFAALQIAIALMDIDVVQVDPTAESLVPARPHDEKRAGIKLDKGLVVDVGELSDAVPALKRRVERFKRLPAAEKGAQLMSGALRYGPYAMFVLLPAFAALLKLLYLGRQRRYPARPRLYGEHLVFAAHNHAFLFLIAVAAIAIPIAPLRTALLAWCTIYMLWSLRVVYRGSWIGIVMRSFAMLIAYSVLFAFVTAGLLVAAVLLR